MSSSEYDQKILTKDQFDELPTYMQVMLVAAGVVDEDWLSDNPYAPDWIESYQAAGGLGFLAGVFGVGLYPTYVVGLENIALRSGVLAGAPYEYTYLGRAAMAQQTATRYAGYGATAFTTAQLGLWEARSQYWVAQQALAPFRWAWGAARLASYLSPTPEAGMTRAFGFTATSALTRLVSAEAMAPGVRMAYQADPTWTMRVLQGKPSVFWPFQVEPMWGQSISGFPGLGELIGGQFGASVGSWTVAQIGFWGAMAGGAEAMAAGPVGAAGRLSAFGSGFGGTIRSVLGYSLMQPGLSFLIDAATIMYVRNAVGIPFTPAESYNINQQIVFGAALTSTGLAYTLATRGVNSDYYRYLAEMRGEGLLNTPLRFTGLGQALIMGAGTAGYLAGGPIGGAVTEQLGLGPRLGQTFGPWVGAGLAAFGTSLAIRELRPGGLLYRAAPNIAERIFPKLMVRGLAGGALGQIAWALTALDVEYQAAQIGASYMGMEIAKKRQAAGQTYPMAGFGGFGASGTWGQGSINLDDLILGSLGQYREIVEQALSPFRSWTEAVMGGPFQFLEEMVTEANDYQSYLERLQSQQSLQRGVARLRYESRVLYGGLALRSAYYTAAGQFWDMAGDYYGEFTGISSVVTGSSGQWTGGRLNELYKLAKSGGISWTEFNNARLQAYAMSAVGSHFGNLAKLIGYPSAAYISRSREAIRIGSPGAFISFPGETPSGKTWSRPAPYTLPGAIPEYPIPRPAGPYTGPIGFGTLTMKPDVTFNQARPIGLATVGLGMQYGITTSAQGYLAGQLTEAQFKQNMQSYGFTPEEMAKIWAWVQGFRVSGLGDAAYHVMTEFGASSEEALKFQAYIQGKGFGYTKSPFQINTEWWNFKGGLAGQGYTRTPSGGWVYTGGGAPAYSRYYPVNYGKSASTPPPTGTTPYSGSQTRRMGNTRFVTVLVNGRWTRIKQVYDENSDSWVQQDEYQA